MTDQQPRVTIGVPVYNGERYLARALDSLLAQTYGDFEIVISDNGSTDNTPEICADYATRDARVRYERQEQNRGVWWNFNRVFELARGEYFRWHAADDLVAAEHLARCVDVLDRLPEVALVYPQTAIIDAEDRLLFQPPPHPAIGPDPDGISAAAETKRRDLLQSSRPEKRFLGILLYATRVTECFGLARTAQLRTTRLQRHFCGSEKVLLVEQCLQGPFYEVLEPLFFNRRHQEEVSCLPVDVKRVVQGGERKSRSPRIPPMLLCAAAHFRLVWQYKLTLPQRAKCLVAWTRYCLQMRKFARVGRDALVYLGLRDPSRHQPPPASSGTNGGVSPQTMANDELVKLNVS